jgi:hypothetical protein
MVKRLEEKGKSFTAFRSAIEEADTKRENEAMKREEQALDNEGGHMTSTTRRAVHISGEGIHEKERLRPIAQTERVLDELDGKDGD